jgi:hypothetical protein
VPRLRRTLAAAVVSLALALLASGCGPSGDETQTTRLTSQDGRTDLVLTVRSGSGAAGFADERIAFVTHGASAHDGREWATADPGSVLGVRWLAHNVAEIGLDGDLPEEASSSAVRVGDRVVGVLVRDFSSCLPAAVRDLPPQDGLTVRVTGWNCGDGVGRLIVTAREGPEGLGAQLADAAVRWPARLGAIAMQGDRIVIPARRIYGGKRTERAGDGTGRTITVSWTRR